MKKDESKNLFTKLAENPSARKGIVAIGILGILLIFLSGLFQNTNSDADASVSSQDSAVNVEEHLYILFNRNCRNFCQRYPVQKMLPS